METSLVNRPNRATLKRSLPNDRQDWTVLIVDDQFDNLIVASVTLQHQGAQVHTAGSAEEGLTVLRTILPTFILLDLSMPKMDGWEMQRVLRDNPQTATIPVIALTAHAMDGDEDRVLAAGFDGYISKPFDIAMLAVHIQCILDSIAERKEVK